MNEKADRVLTPAELSKKTPSDMNASIFKDEFMKTKQKHLSKFKTKHLDKMKKNYENDDVICTECKFGELYKFILAREPDNSLKW